MWDEARQAAASSSQKSPWSSSSSSPTTEDDGGGGGGAKGVAGPFDSSLYDNVAENPYVDYVKDSPYDNVIDSDSRYSSVADGSRGGGAVVNKPFFIPDEDGDGFEDDADSPEPLARQLGLGGHGPLVTDRLALLASLSPPSSPRESGARGGVRAVPKILPSLYFGDLRAGDVQATAETMELCHKRGVQAFSLRCVGGKDGEEAGKGAAAAADYEHEDVSVTSRQGGRKLRPSPATIEPSFLERIWLQLTQSCARFSLVFPRLFRYFPPE